MDYKKERNKFLRKKYKKTLRLERKFFALLWVVEKLNNLDGLILKLAAILMGFQYDTLIALRNVSYNNEYLEAAKSLEIRINEIVKELYV